MQHGSWSRVTLRSKIHLMATEKETTVDVREILSIVLKRKWLIIVPLVLVAAVTFAGSYMITPQYKSSTIVQIDPQVKLINELQGLLGTQSGFRRLSSSEKADQLNSYYNELTSTYYTRLLDERLNLTQEADIERLARSYVQRQPSMTIESARIAVLQRRLQNTLVLRWAAGDQIEIEAQSPDPVMARNIAQTLGEIFIDEKVRQELNQLRTSQDFSDIQLEKYEQQLQKKIREKTNLEKEYISIQLDDNISAESNRSEIRAEIDRTSNEIEDLRKHERDLISRITSESNLAVGQLVIDDSAEKNRLEEEMRAELDDVGNLMLRYTWRDPQVINFKVRQNNRLNAIEAENRKLVSKQYSSQDEEIQNLLVDLFNTRSSLDYLTTRRPNLQASLDELNAKIELSPDYQARLNQLDREIAAATDLRDKFKRQQESSSISQALVQDMSSDKYRIVEPAKLAMAPFKPDRRKILFLGIILGLVVGGAAAILVEVLDTSFRKVDDVEQALGLPVLAVTPKIDFMKKVAS